MDTANQQLYAITKNIGITMYAATSLKLIILKWQSIYVDFSAVLTRKKQEVLNSNSKAKTLFIAHSLPRC